MDETCSLLQDEREFDRSDFSLPSRSFSLLQLVTASFCENMSVLHAFRLVFSDAMLLFAFPRYASHVFYFSFISTNCKRIRGFLNPFSLR